MPENVRVAVQKDSLLVCYFGGSTLKKARPNRPPFRVAHPGSRSPVQPRASPTAARRSSGRQSCFRPSDNSRRPCLFTAAACPRACSGTSAGCAPASCTRLRCSGRRWRCVRARREHLRRGCAASPPSFAHPRRRPPCLCPLPGAESGEEAGGEVQGGDSGGAWRRPALINSAHCDSPPRLLPTSPQAEAAMLAPPPAADETASDDDDEPVRLLDARPHPLLAVLFD